MNLLQRLTTTLKTSSRSDGFDWFEFAQIAYRLGWQGTLTGDRETIPRLFHEMVGYGLQGNAAVWAIIATRMLAFSTPRLAFQRMRNGRPDELWSDRRLDLLERPWDDGATQDLLGRMLIDVDVAGNAYIANVDRQLVRLRPDWIEILLSPIQTREGTTVGWRKLGYIYTPEDGSGPASLLDRREVAHWAPYPDPLARWRGMSWMTPVVREIAADTATTKHKLKFFENGATPNLFVSWPKEVPQEKVRSFKKMLDEDYAGVDNAYKSLFLGGGATANVVGKDLKQLDFANTQGAGETRLAAAAGVPPVIVGFDKGLQSATYSNYGQARRRFADGTLHPLWASCASSLQTLVPAPSGSRLWYDARDVPLLREDAKDATEIQRERAATIVALVNGGFTPDSAIAAVEAEDMSLLVATGLVSVQLQPPGSTTPPPDPSEDE